MLEDIGIIVWICEIVDQEKSITKYIYNHTNVLSTMRIYTKGKEFVLDQKINLKRMFLGPKCKASKHGKTLQGIEIVALISNDCFYKDLKGIIAMIVTCQNGQLVQIPVFKLQSQTSFPFQISFISKFKILATNFELSRWFMATKL